MMREVLTRRFARLLRDTDENAVAEQNSGDGGVDWSFGRGRGLGL